MIREEAVLRRLRRICLALPEATETTTFGHPTFRAGGRTFAVLEEFRDLLLRSYRLVAKRHTS